MKKTLEILKFGRETGEYVTCTKTDTKEFCGFGHKTIWISEDGRKFVHVIIQRRYSYFEER